MAAVRKYMFDDSFDDAEVVICHAPDTPPDESALRHLESLARTDGFEAGRVAALEDAAMRAADAVQQMAARLSTALSDADDFVMRTTEDAAELAIAAANHLAGPAAPMDFAAHARSRLASIIAEQIGSPRLSVSVSPAMRPHVQAAADHVVGSATYAGRVDVIGDASLGGCDLVIDWKSGALTELRRDRLDALAAKIAEYFDISTPEGEA